MISYCIDFESRGKLFNIQHQLFCLSAIPSETPHEALTVRLGHRLEYASSDADAKCLRIWPLLEVCGADVRSAKRVGVPKARHALQIVLSEPVD